MKFYIESKTHGRHAVLVDDEDAEKVLSYRWCLSKKGDACFYAVNRRDGIYLHRLIIRAQKGKTVDHVNGDSLDNRKCNLRECTTKENIRNRKGRNKNSTSGIKGVFWIKNAKKWRAQIKVDRVVIYLGYFTDKIKAATAYNEAAKKYHGEFASYNEAALCK